MSEMPRTPSAPAAPSMTFGTAIVTVFRKYADFTGRAGLAEFWWFMLFSFVVNMGLRVLDMGLIAGTEVSFGLLSSLWWIATIVPALAVSVRRLRDGDNRWTQLFWLLLPVAGLIIVIVRLCDPPAPPERVSDRGVPTA